MKGCQIIENILETIVKELLRDQAILYTAKSSNPTVSFKYNLSNPFKVQKSKSLKINGNENWIKYLNSVKENEAINASIHIPFVK